MVPINYPFGAAFGGLAGVAPPDDIPTHSVSVPFGS